MNRLVDGIGETVITAGNAFADDGNTTLGKRLLDIVEVGVDNAHAGNNVGYGFCRLANQFVRTLESDRHIHILVNHNVFLVVHHEQRIDMLRQLGRSRHGLANLDFALESKRKRDDSHRKNIEFLRYLGNDRRSTRTCTTAHSGNDKDHLGAVTQSLLDVLAALLRQIASLLRVAACPQPLETNLEFVGDTEFLHSLQIGIANHEGNIVEAVMLVQLVDGVAATPADTDNLDDAIGGYLQRDGDDFVIAHNKKLF